MQPPTEKGPFHHLSDSFFGYIDDHKLSYLQTWQQWCQMQQHEHRSNYTALLDYLQHQPAPIPTLDLEHEIIYGADATSSTRPSLFCYLSLEDIEPGYTTETLPFFACQAALDAYQQQHGPAPVSVKWILQKQVLYEETKRKHIVTEQHAFLQPAPCLWYFTHPSGWEQYYPGGVTPAMLLGTKGLLSVNITSHTTTATLPLHYGSIVPDAAWILNWVLSSIKNKYEDILIDGFYDSIEPPEEQVLAILATLPDDTQIQRAQWHIANFLPGLHAHAQYKHYAYFLTPTCNITRFHTSQLAASTAQDVQALVHDAQAQLDFLLVSGQDPQTLFAQLQHHLENEGFTDVRTTTIQAQHPLSIPYQHPFTQQVRSALAQTYQRDPLILPYLPAYMPIGLLEYMHTPTILLPQSSNPIDADERFIAMMKTFIALFILFDQNT